MFRPRWRKVLRDLWHNKTRTGLAILSIAVGVFAVGMIVSTQIIVSQDLSKSYASINPASAELYPNHFDQDLVEAIRRIDGIAEAEGRRSIRLRMQTGPEEWGDIRLDVIQDYEDIRLNIIRPVAGEWPPRKKTLLIEHASLPLTKAELGDNLVLETRDGKLRSLPITGLVHDINKPPAQFEGRAFGYITLDTLTWLGESPKLDELYIKVAEKQDDEDHIRAMADLVEQKIEKSGLNVYWTWIPTPGEHPANDAVQPMLLILGVLGFLALFLSGFLVFNTISALLAQQIKQIGVMKTIGANTRQIMSLYLSLVAAFGLLSLLLAVPLGALAAFGLSSYLANLINFNIDGLRVPLPALLGEVAVGILVPLIAALLPIFVGARISIREAISEYGLGKGQFGTHLLDRLVEWLTSTALKLSRPMRVSLRNTIRRKARLALTLFTLTLGGAIFISVLSVHASLLATLDDALAYWAYDVDINFARGQRIPAIKREALQVPGVLDAESWIGNTARRMRDDGYEGPNFSVLGVPAQTQIIQPTLLQGRWLHADDSNALVLNSEVLKEEPDIQVGDEIKLTIEGREQNWKVVGLVQGVMTGRVAYANLSYFAQVTRYMGRSGGVQVVGEDKSPAGQQALALALKEHFDSRGMQVSSTNTTANTRKNIEYQFNIIVVFLSIMAILIALVGALGLMGTMSMNVLERTREIGVMRAVGASNASIRKIVLVEGICIGLLSWLIGSLLAVPIGKFLSDGVGIAFLEAPLRYTYATTGALGWLLGILFLALIAGLWPAWHASRVSVRQSLAYE